MRPSIARNAVFIVLLCCSPFISLAQSDTTTDVAALLQLSLEELMDIKVVTASGYKQTTAEAPSTITVISAKQIQERGYEQLEDALRDIPGIDMIHLNGYAPTLIYFRGMYGAENLRALLMIDGIAENNIIGTNDMAGPAYSLHNVERIEIIWGPASALYGANAFGGVINIISKKGGDINGIYAKKGFGSFNTSFEKIALGLRKNAFEFTASGMLYSSDGPKFKNRDINYNGSYVDKAYSLNANLSYYAKKSTTTIGYRVYKTPMGWGTILNSPTVFLGLPPQGYGNSGVLGIISRDIRGEKSGLNSPYLRTLHVQNEWTPTKKLAILSRLVYRETGTSSDSYAYLTLDGRKLIRAIVASYSNRVNADLNANYTLSEMHKFSAGMQYFQDNVERGSRKATLDTTNDIYLIDGRDTVTNLHATFLPRQYDVRTNFGGYLQYMLSTHLLGKTNFTIGARNDYNSYFGNAFSPRFTIVNRPRENLTFKLQVGKAFRAPTNTEIYQTPPNITLKTEKLKTYEVNLDYNFRKKVRLQLNAFRNEMTDVIFIGNLSGLNTDKNPGRFDINGVEGLADFSFSKTVNGFVNLTYQDAKGKNLTTGASGKIPGIAKWKGNAGITFLVGGLFTLNLTGNWVGERRVPRTDPYGPVAGYVLANCNLRTVELFGKGIVASFNIRNLFDRKWLDPGFRTADGFLYSTVLEQPGINGMFKVSIRL